MTSAKSRMSPPGVKSPVAAGRPGLNITAWRNLDKPKAKPNFHVVLKIRGQQDLEMLGLTPDRIKEIGEQFLDIHTQIVADTPSCDGA